MSSIKKADQEMLKNLNRQIVLNHIRKYGEISRIDLAKHTKLSPTTVSTITSELVSQKLVTEIRIGESSGGRKPLMFGINPNARFVVVAVLDQKGAVFTIVDLNYHRVESECIFCKVEGRENVIEILLEGWKRILGKFQYDTHDICGLAVSIPGVIDHKNGKVLYSSKLHLKDFDIAPVLKDHTGIKTYIFKDIDALILGEFNSGIGNAYNNLVYINVEDGVGMSYINSGKLLMPGYGGGFELGHITIDSNGPLCRCGNRGCLGAVASEQPVISKFRLLCEKGYETLLEGDIGKLSLADIVAYSNRGDKACRYVLEEQARILGTAVATVINLFNPQLVVIGGPLSKCKWEYLDALKDTVRDRALETYSRNVDIKPAKLGDEAALIGMASEIFAQEIFKIIEL